MDVNEIFNLPEIKILEVEILDTQHDLDRNRYCANAGVEFIKKALMMRKQLLDRKFVMDEFYKKLLEEFNEALKVQMLKMRLETIKTYNSAVAAGLEGDVEAVGKCFLGYKYPDRHPVQTARARKMWDILNGSIDNYVPLYEDGVNCHGFRCSKEHIESENQLLYLNEQEDNWNEGFDRELTKDMHLLYAVHNLFDHTSFSVFDFLWVRDFDIEITLNTEYRTYKHEADNPDWDEIDYLD